MTDNKTPQELDALDIDTIDVEYKGATYRFPADIDDADGDVMDAIDNEKLSHALRGLMGADQWARFKKTAPKARDYKALFNSYAATAGLGDLGE
jgi:hypothetical protein